MILKVILNYSTFDCFRYDADLDHGGGGQHGGRHVRQQVSLESAQSQDSRMCYLTSSEVSQSAISRI